MDQLLGFAFGLGVMFVADWGFRFWERVNEAKDKSNTRNLLKEHGLTPHKYLSSMGEKDPDIRHARNVSTSYGQSIQK